MEYGLIPKIDQFRDNRSLELEQVHASTQTSKLGERNNLSELRREEFLKAGETAQIEKAKNESATNSYEYVLTNMNFGFNDSSKDFFVRAQRGESQNQFPTEDMMKLKAFLMNQAKDSAS
ncbi:hypothetical protein [Arcobacter sp. YIC-80]|uniref:hypothetical protein n=1 Tax=unclassified Arcobacter TaxID=2593671 RepID=UPI003850B2EA